MTEANETVNEAGDEAVSGATGDPARDDGAATPARQPATERGAGPRGPRRLGGGGGRAPNRSARHRAREFAMQGVYQWLLSQEAIGVIQAHIERSPGFSRADRPHFELLLRTAIRQAPDLDALIVPHLDRELTLLSPVERAILMIAVVELRDLQEIPYRVVINEAVDLAKDFGGTDGYKFVNGVLDRLAVGLRPVEVGSNRR